jgi:peptide/nickel transport system ATP-binding protein
MTPLLHIKDLRVNIDTARGPITPVNNVSLEIAPGEMLGLVGESGSGKSMTAMSILQMLPAESARITGGSITFDGDNLVAMPERKLRQIRGGKVGTIFQEPMTALNPVLSIGDQLTEPVRKHLGMNRRQAYARGLEMLDMVGIRDPKRVMADYPFQLSGGMRQRVMIAMAMSCEPKLLIADEPTTALDVTTQLQILDLMVGLQRDHGTAILLITHDLGVIAQTCQRVAVMYGGQIVETATVDDLFERPQHDYTRRLLSFLPKPEDRPGTTQPRERAAILPDAVPLLEVKDLTMHYETRRPHPLAAKPEPVKAVDGVSFSVQRGSTLAIVGESGSGKTTTGRAVLRLVEPTAGSVMFEGRDILAMNPEAMRAARSDMQIIFQDTYASLDPRWHIGRSLAEPLVTHSELTKNERADRVAEILELVGLEPSHADRFPHEFSGGQRQRIGIARALMLKPSFIVCDEPVSALDVSVQAQVLDLMKKLQAELGLTYLFISHDLSVVAEMADDVIVMNRGRIVEQASVAQLYNAPQHPYTKALLAAVPQADPRAKNDREERRRLVDAGLAAAGVSPESLA